MSDWVTAKEIATIAGCGMTKARQLLKELNKESKAEGYWVPNPYKANRRRLMKRLGLETRDEKRVRKEMPADLTS